jgi:hypothetical protein
VSVVLLSLRCPIMVGNTVKGYHKNGCPTDDEISTEFGPG